MTENRIYYDVTFSFIFSTVDQVVNFLYSGQIPVENEKNLIENLVRVFGFAENLKIVGSNPVKGQAHDMLSRIFRIRIYKFIPLILRNIVLIFTNNTEKKPFLG